MNTRFQYGHAGAARWEDAAQRCLEQLGATAPTANLGFLYATDVFSEHMADILDFFKLRTGVPHWTGTIGVGICGTGAEYLDEPAIAVMLGSFPADSFRVFPALTNPLEILGAPDAPKVANAAAHFAIVHGDPHTAGIADMVSYFAEKMETGFLAGGLTSSRARSLQIADDVVHGGLSGVMFSSAVPVSTRLTQGVSPLGPRHVITAAERNILISLDERPALEVFKEDIGEVLARDMNRVAGYIFAGLPIPGSDTGDYRVRNLIGIDTGNQLIAVGELVEPGQELMFCRRDGASAYDDMQRMLDEIKQSLAGPPRGGVYYSCLGRGENMFGPGARELNMIREYLGDFPLVGFFANGEISHNQLYGYTGVLTVFI